MNRLQDFVTSPNVLKFLNARDIVMVSLVNKETYSKVKRGEMVWKSISRGHLPSEYRREYWSNNFIASTEFNYSEATKKAFADTDLEFTKDEISRDISRTYLVNTCEEDKDALMRMLVVFAFCHPEIRYCQGLNFVAGVLYKALGEDDGTKCLLGMVAKYQLEGLFTPGLPDLHLREYQMNHYIHKYFPKLFAHFKENSVTTGFFIARWFMTLYSVYLPYETLLRVWDFFMTKGWKALFQTGLGIFDEIQEILLKLDLGGVSAYIREHARNDHLDYHKLLKAAVARKVTNTELKRLEEEFYINQAGLKIERIQTIHIDQDVLQETKSQLERFKEPVMSDINYFKTVLEDLVKDLHRKLKEFFQIQQQINEIERRIEHLCEVKSGILENIHTCQKQPKPQKTVVICERDHDFPTIICSLIKAQPTKSDSQQSQLCTKEKLMKINKELKWFQNRHCEIVRSIQYKTYSEVAQDLTCITDRKSLYTEKFQGYIHMFEAQKNSILLSIGKQLKMHPIYEL